MQNNHPPSFENLSDTIVRRVAQVVDIDASAERFKAFRRPRGIKSAEDLLRLAFIYGPGGLSLRMTSGIAEAAKIASLSDVALLKRLRNTVDWLAYILGKLLMSRTTGVRTVETGRRVCIVDGSSLSKPGSKGTDWRLHILYRPDTSELIDVQLTDSKGAESFKHFVVNPHDIFIGDRYYAKVKDLRHIIDSNGDFIVRSGWRSLSLKSPDGSDFNMIKTLSSLAKQSITTSRSFKVVIPCSCHGKNPINMRLIILPKPEAAKSLAIKKARRGASRKGNALDPKTELAAGFLMILTSLEESEYSDQKLLEMYRMRWQIELMIKRMKSLINIDNLPAKEERLAKAWIYAHLIYIIIIEEHVQDFLDFFPSAIGRNR